MAKVTQADSRLHGLTVGALDRNRTLKRIVEDILHEQDYELVMPPDNPTLGDQFLGGGKEWHPVTEVSFSKKSFSSESYIVRRPTEHLRMVHFFFGRPKE